MIGRAFGQYQVVEKIGAGGMGEVYRARDGRLGREVALKFLPEHARRDRIALERLLQEARAASALNHPNICTIHDIGEHEGHSFIVMELLEGRTLEELLASGPLGVGTVAAIGGQIADGLDAAHAKAILHRDVKPANVFVTERGQAKILDFGVAKLERAPGLSDSDTLTSDDARLSLTAPGGIIGTVTYMSPEQALGEEIDGRSDLFSLGIVLYHMATGCLPFEGKTAVAILAAILHATPCDPIERKPDLPPALGRVILKALAKDRDRRYQTAAELRADLVRIVHVGAEPTALAAKSIAVLPFTNLSDDRENEYFADGVAEEIINALCRLEGLHVVSRRSAFRYKVRDEDVKEIGAALGVHNVLEGSVRRAGNRLRITVQLVSVADGYHVWSERYDREMEDVFAVQDEIAENVAQSLSVALTEAQKQAIRAPRARNVEAYDAYLRGRRFVHQHHRKGWEYAVEMFGHAIAIDPGYGPAHAGLALCLALLSRIRSDSPDSLAEADSASLRALELEPGLADGHVARALVLWLRSDVSGAADAFEEAIRLDPQSYDAHYFAGMLHLKQLGRSVEAGRYFEKAALASPEDYQAHVYLGLIYHGQGDVEKSHLANRRAIELIDKSLAREPGNARALSCQSVAYARLGDRRKAVGSITRAADLLPDEPEVLYLWACIHAVLGETDEAFRALERAIDGGLSDRQWLLGDPDLESLRRDPRFAALLDEKLGD